MRERSEATVAVYSATGNAVPWHSEASLALDWDAEDAAHIAAWSPAVALAVAGLLDLIAEAIECAFDAELFVKTNPTARHALAVARAYLGDDS